MREVALTLRFCQYARSVELPSGRLDFPPLRGAAKWRSRGGGGEPAVTWRISSTMVARRRGCRGRAERSTAGFLTLGRTTPSVSAFATLRPIHLPRTLRAQGRKRVRRPLI